MNIVPRLTPARLLAYGLIGVMTLYAVLNLLRGPDNPEVPPAPPPQNGAPVTIEDVTPAPAPDHDRSLDAAEFEPLPPAVATPPAAMPDPNLDIDTDDDDHHYHHQVKPRRQDAQDKRRDDDDRRGVIRRILKRIL